MKIELVSVTPDAEKVIEAAGRTAYRSFDKASDQPLAEAEREKAVRTFRADTHAPVKQARPGQTLRIEGGAWTVRRVWRNSAEKFVHMLVAGNHLSVLEHASATLRIAGVSRALTHQLVRHRMASYTQQSQRYVNEEGFGFVEPPAVAANPEAHEAFVDFMDRARETYLRLQDMGVQNEDARFVLPNAVESEIVVTANLREWRHILSVRGEPAAQWEIRRAMCGILAVLKGAVPSAFSDLEWDEGKGIVGAAKSQAERRGT